MQLPQQVLFSWTPRNTASPNSALNTEYELSLYEVRPEDANPNDIVLSTPPVFQITTNFNQYIYGIADPPLIEGIQYAWRVRAIDITGRDAFRNQGFSEVCSFTYKGSLGGISTGLVAGFTAEGKTQSRADFGWQADPEQFDGYRIEYKKVGEGYHWFPLEIRSGEQDYVKVFDVGPSTAYEARIQGKKDGFYGSYSEIIPFVTPGIREYACGQNTYNPLPPGAPLTSAYTNMVVMARDKPLTCTEITPLDQPGWFRGKGYVKMDVWAGANFAAIFDRLQIDENLRVVGGGIKLISKPLDEWVDERDGNQSEKEQIRAQNQANWQGVDFYHEMTFYDHHDMDSITYDPSAGAVYLYVSGHEIVFRNKEIHTFLIDNPDDAYIIQDKSGDQWVIDKDGKVHEVKGGGLRVPSYFGVSKDANRLVKAALKEIHKTYTKAHADTLKISFEYQDRLFEQKTPLPQATFGRQGSTVSKLRIHGSTTTDQSYELQNLSRLRLAALITYQQAKILNLLSEPPLDNFEVALIAENLQIDGQNLESYLQTAKANNQNRQTIIDTIKIHIIQKIEQTITQLYAKP